MIFVVDWHPSLSKLPSILKHHYNILQNNTKQKEIFNTCPTVAFRKRKSIRDLVVRTDIVNKPSKQLIKTQPCGNCKFCPNIDSSEFIQGLNIKLRSRYGGDCKTRGIVYAAKCKRHDLVYVGHTGDTPSSRFSKHRYDIKKDRETQSLPPTFTKIMTRMIWK